MRKPSDSYWYRGSEDTFRLSTPGIHQQTIGQKVSAAEGLRPHPFYVADPYLLDLDTGEYEPITDNRGGYDEAEGIAPDGTFLLMESDRVRGRAVAGEVSAGPGGTSWASFP